MHLWTSRFYAEFVDSRFVSVFLMGESLDLMGLGINPLSDYTRWSLSESHKHQYQKIPVP